MLNIDRKIEKEVTNTKHQSKGEVKMKKLVLTIGLVLGLTSAAVAQPFPALLSGDPHDSTPDAVVTPDDTAVAQNIHDAVNLLLSTAHTANEDIDGLQVTSSDKFWTDLSTTAFDGTFIGVSVTAANKNTLRVYDTTAPAVKIPVLGPFSGFTFLGDGSIGSPFPASTTPLAAGANFGWSLRSVGASGGIWDSDPTANIDGFDHMVTYHLAALGGSTVYIDTGAGATPYTFFDPFLIAFEDKPFNPITGRIGDEDYNDIIFLVDRVTPPPIPEPMSMLLMGSGLVGLVGMKRRKKVS